jgi:Zinc knuckle
MTVEPTSNTTPPTSAPQQPGTGTLPEQQAVEWKLVWPNLPNHTIQVAAADLPHVIPGATRIPPCTLRYLLPADTNIKNINVTDSLRFEIYGQLDRYNHNIAIDSEVCFPPVQGSHDRKEVILDISIPTPTLYRQALRSPPKLKITTRADENVELLLKGTGPAVPANILTVAIFGLPSGPEETSIAKDLFEALNKYKPAEIEVWDIFSRYVSYPAWNGPAKFTGAMYACVHFKNCSPRHFPTEFVKSTFPGFIRIRHQVFALEYADKIDHCWTCKDKAAFPHTVKDCNKKKCWYCGAMGHLRTECPKYEHMDEDHQGDQQGEDPGRSGANPRKRLQPEV